MRTLRSFLCVLIAGCSLSLPGDRRTVTGEWANDAVQVVASDTAFAVQFLCFGAKCQHGASYQTDNTFVVAGGWVDVDSFPAAVTGVSRGDTLLVTLSNCDAIDGTWNTLVIKPLIAGRSPPFATAFRMCPG
jgi:hypothetical protein